MTIDEAVDKFETIAKEYAEKIQNNLNVMEMIDLPLQDESLDYFMIAEANKQVAEWLKELKAYRELADGLVKAVLEEDWEESADFYAEVLCRKLTKLGKLKVEDNKYMEVNADE